MAAEVTSQTGERQLIRIEGAAALLAGKLQDKSKLAAALQAVCTSSDPLVRGAVARGLPATATSDDLEKAVMALIEDADPLVRLASFERLEKMAALTGERGKMAAAMIEKATVGEKDPWLKDWLAAMPPAKAEGTQPPK